MSRQLFTQDWKFFKGDCADGYYNEFNDADWRNIDLPHDFSIEGPFSDAYASGTGYLPGGIGWYRKTFTLPPEATGKDVYIRFDGVYQNSEVWCNEHSLGKRPYGYSSFTYRLTPYLRTDGQPNVLAVPVDHTKFADSRWYTGSGIYRNVYLRITAPQHVKQDGVCITTPRITEQDAQIDIHTTLQNTSDQESEIALCHEIFEAGAVIGGTRERVTIPANGECAVDSMVLIQAPKRWSPDTPNLYTAVTTLLKNGQAIDTYETIFGIREFRFDPNTGFWLNGENMKIKGLCVHHDAGALGAAVPAKVWERRLNIFKEAGCNAIRMSHNPPDPLLLDLCDRMGFLVMDEAFDEWEHPKKKWVEGRNFGTPSFDGYAKHFQEWGERDIQDMVIRDRNHPSIILWSIGNEVDYPHDPYSHPIAGEQYDPSRPHANELAGIAKKLVSAVKAIDTTRPVTAALAHVPSSNLTGYADALDVVGYNYQEHLYSDDHQHYPQRVIYGSENGKHHDAWLAVADNDYISGQFLWTGIDFLGEARPWPQRNSQAGILDLADFKKPLFYLIQSRWSDTPMVYFFIPGVTAILPARMMDEMPEIPTVICFSNCESVEVWLDDQSLGEQRVADIPDRELRWELQDWQGTLKAVGKNNGKPVCGYELTKAGPAAQLTACADTDELRADGQDVAHVEVNLLDTDGHLAFDADHLVTCEISGPGKILGIENGDPESHEDYQALQHHAYQGRLLIYVQSQKEAGDFRLKVTAPGLSSAGLTIRVKN